MTQVQCLGGCTCASNIMPPRISCRQLGFGVFRWNPLSPCSVPYPCCSQVGVDWLLSLISASPRYHMSQPISAGSYLNGGWHQRPGALTSAVVISHPRQNTRHRSICFNLCLAYTRATRQTAVRADIVARVIVLKVGSRGNLRCSYLRHVLYYHEHVAERHNS